MSAVGTRGSEVVPGQANPQPDFEPYPRKNTPAAENPGESFCFAEYETSRTIKCLSFHQLHLASLPVSIELKKTSTYFKRQLEGKLSKKRSVFLASHAAFNRSATESGFFYLAYHHSHSLSVCAC